MSKPTKALLLLLFWAVIALGLFNWPDGWLAGSSSTWRVIGLVYLVSVCSVPPLVFSALLWPEWMQTRPLRRSASVTLWLLALASLLAIAPATIAAGTHHQFALIALKCLAHALYFSMADGLLRWAAGYPSILRAGYACLAATLLFALSLWSLVYAGLMIRQAESIADGRDYCIADTKLSAGLGSGHYSPVHSLFDLRWTELAAEKSGYKSSSLWYFHALLYVPGSAQATYWNWSIAEVTFRPLSPEAVDRLIISVEEPCVPEPRFWETLVGGPQAIPDRWPLV